MKKVISIFILLVSSQSLLAGGWSNDLTVESVSTYGEGEIVTVRTQDVSGSNAGVYAAGCNANEWIIKADTEARLSRIYSTLIAAAISGKTINLHYSDVCASWNYHHGSIVRLNK
jgi:hypothetical protein